MNGREDKRRVVKGPPRVGGDQQANPKTIKSGVLSSLRWLEVSNTQSVRLPEKHCCYINKRTSPRWLVGMPPML